MPGYADIYEDMSTKDLIETYQRALDQIKPNMEYRESKRVTNKLDMLEHELKKRGVPPFEYHPEEPDIGG